MEELKRCGKADSLPVHSNSQNGNFQSKLANFERDGECTIFTVHGDNSKFQNMANLTNLESLYDNISSYLIEKSRNKEYYQNPLLVK